jgi:protein TonB
VVPAEAAAPAAVMIELAPEPVAPDSVEEQIAPDLVDAPEVPTEPLPDVTEPPAPDAMPEIAQPAPPEQPEPPLPQVETQVADALPTVQPPPELPAEAVEPRPVARPKTLARIEPPKPERKSQPEPPSKVAVRAQVEAPKAPVAAARQTSSGSQGGGSPARWQSRLMAHLERHKRYPQGARSRREQGTAQVRFSIDGGGNVQSVRLVRSSGYAELDEAVVALVRRASPVPAPPPGAPREVTAPVQFRVR